MANYEAMDKPPPKRPTGAGERPVEVAKLDPGSPANPTPFGRYLLLGMIARGGMAEVYRAKERTAELGPEGMLYAVKCMRPQLAKEARFVDMFMREGRLAMLLQHPSIVRTVEISSVGRIGAHHYIAMEYVSGKDLTQILRRCQETNQRIPVPHAVTIAARMCEGLQFAHTLVDGDGRALNIVNRDVSPSNVRVSFDGEVKLLDFGIAQAMLKITSEIGVLKGKFSYMSPEQIRGMPVDARTDVFSTGIILHEMLTTEKLFRSDTEFALMEKVRKADVAPPSKFNRRVPEALDRIVMKALARDLPDRYQSAAELGAELNEFVSQYKLKATEMQELVRGLFRADYQKESEEAAACRAASMPPDGHDDGPGPAGASGVGNEFEEIEVSVDSLGDGEVVLARPRPQRGAPASAATQNRDDRDGDDARNQAGDATPPSHVGDPGSQGGLWARLRGRFSK